MAFSFFSSGCASLASASLAISACWAWSSGWIADITMEATSLATAPASAPATVGALAAFAEACSAFLALLRAVSACSMALEYAACSFLAAAVTTASSERNCLLLASRAAAFFSICSALAILASPALRACAPWRFASASAICTMPAANEPGPIESTRCGSTRCGAALTDLAARSPRVPRILDVSCLPTLPSAPNPAAVALMPASLPRREMAAVLLVLLRCATVAMAIMAHMPTPTSRTGRPARRCLSPEGGDTPYEPYVMVTEVLKAALGSRRA
mmetsp:Transcript_4307/g.6338  ORF Transcript_4307/g.6338 Transcript_4307/m.6338 type:complete len:273 (-) Transcript_4307:409-1227(-)